jgi:hypothetical protein
MQSQLQLSDLHTNQQIAPLYQSYISCDHCSYVQTRSANLAYNNKLRQKVNKLSFLIFFLKFTNCRSRRFGELALIYTINTIYVWLKAIIFILILP